MQPDGRDICYRTGIITCDDEHEFLEWKEKFVKLLTKREGISQSEVNAICDGAEAFIKERLSSYNEGQNVFRERVFFELFPFFSHSNFVSSAFYKNHGYAGDYETIDIIYSNKAIGLTELGRMLDRWMLNHDAAEAVRARRRFICEFISTVQKQHGPIQVASIGCGPAMEVADLTKLVSSGDAKFDLYDIDEKALTFAKMRLEEHGVYENVAYLQRNVLMMAKNGCEDDNKEKYQVVYSLGLIDYLKDSTISRLLNWVYDSLGEGGCAVFGNFNEGHHDEAVMKYILDWNLINRSPERLMKIAEKSKFGKAGIRVEQSIEGIQLYMVLNK